MPMAQHKVVSRRLTEIRPDEALAAGQLIADTWPRPDRGPVERAAQLERLGAEYAGPSNEAPISALVFDRELCVAHATSFARTVETAEGPLTVMALAMVTSHEGYRGQGLGALVVRAAFERVDARDFTAALFQTSNAVRPFYERLGACVVTNRIVNSQSDDDPQANPFHDELVMRYPASGPWPEGEIDLAGPGY